MPQTWQTRLTLGLLHDITTLDAVTLTKDSASSRATWTWRSIGGRTSPVKRRHVSGGKTVKRARPVRGVKPAAKPKSKHTGPETRYNPAKLPEVVNALEAGQTQAAIAQRIFGVRPEQLSRWKQAHPQLTQAIETGVSRYWEAACDNVERVSVASATGRVPRIVKEVRDAEGRLTGEKVIEYHPPAVGMAVFLLCNKRPDKWQNVQRVEVRRDGEGPRPLIFVVERGEALRPVEGEIVKALPGGGAQALEAEKTETSEERNDGDRQE